MEINFTFALREGNLLVKRFENLSLSNMKQSTGLNKYVKHIQEI